MTYRITYQYKTYAPRRWHWEDKSVTVYGWPKLLLTCRALYHSPRCRNIHVYAAS